MLRREFKYEFKKTALYADVSFRTRLERLLRENFDRNKKELIRRHAGNGGISAAELEKAIDAANNAMIQAILRRVAEWTAPTETRLNELNNDLEMFRTLPEYAALANEPRDFLESRLYEDLLEYTIYLLNESKGVTRHEEAAE